MRFLLLSDIHGNTTAVRKLRAMEGNRFDAVVVAGDIKSEDAAEIMGTLATFECPVLYVYGNWDDELSYDESFGPNCHHLHFAPFLCGPLASVGFSGCPSNWGRNPIAELAYRQVYDQHADVRTALADARKAFSLTSVETKACFSAGVAELTARAKARGREAPARANVAKLERERDARIGKLGERVQEIEASKAFLSYRDELRTVSGGILAENRRSLVEAIKASSTPVGRTIVVTHERLSKTYQDFSGIPLFIFGHRHCFADTTFRGARFVDVAALDMRPLVLPKETDSWNPSQSRNVNAGNYVVIEWTEAGGFGVSCVRLDPYPWQDELEIAKNRSMREAPFPS